MLRLEEFVVVVVLVVWVVFVVMFEKLRKEDGKNVGVLIKGDIFCM